MLTIKTPFKFDLDSYKYPIIFNRGKFSVLSSAMAVTVGGAIRKLCNSSSSSPGARH